MTLLAPQHLLIVIPLLWLLLWAYRRAERRTTQLAYEYSHLPFIEEVVAKSAAWSRFLFGFFTLGVALLGLSYLGPHFALTLPARDGSVVLCIDTSGSMASSDVAPTRADAAQNALHVFVGKVGNGVKIGLVSFSSEAQTLLQPTTDLQQIANALDEIPAPNGATAIGDALQLAGELLPRTGKRAIVLLTDGVNNRGVDPLEAAQTLARNHITLYTIGIGTNDSGQTIPGSDEEASADPEALKTYAETTGGQAFQATNAAQIASAFSGLASEAVWETQRIDASQAFALAGGICVTLVFLVGFTVGKYP